MSYDRFGRTPEQARRERVRFWVILAVSLLMLSPVVAVLLLA